MSAQTMQTITINWGTGIVTINPDLFFPCSAKKLDIIKKKMIDCTILYSDREDAINNIKSHLWKRCQKEPDNKKLHNNLKKVMSWK